MSKIDFKFPLDSVSGKIGDLVFCDGPLRTYVRVYVPPDPNRIINENEKRVRGNFTRAVSLWRTLTPNYKELYKKFAYQTTKNKKTGWNVFLEDYLGWLHTYNVQQLNEIFIKFFEYWASGEKKEQAWEKAMEEVRSQK